MTIAAVCPHCEVEFQLQPDLVGKTIRCPNFDCREPFTVAVKSPAAPPPLPTPAPAPAPAEPSRPVSANVSDFLPILEAGPAPTALPYERIEAPPAKPLREAEPFARPATAIPTARLLPNREVPAAKRIDSASAPARPKEEGPKEVHWSEAMGDAPAPPSLPTADQPPSGPDAEPALIDDPVFRRRRQRSTPQIILVSLIVTTIALALGAAGWYFFIQRETEAKLANDAQEAYDGGNFGAAATICERLIAEYSTSADVPKYQFLKSLCGLRGTVSGVTAKESPQSGMKVFGDFVKDWGTNPFAKADGSAYGGDIYLAGRQVIDNLIAFAEAQTAEFKADRSVLKPLEQSESSLVDARKLFPSLQPFKVKDSPPLDTQQAAIDKTAALNGFERHRLGVLAPYRSLPDQPTDEGIERFEQVLRREKLDGDREAQEIVARAKTRLKELIVSTAVSIPSVTAPPATDPTVAFASRVERPPQPPGRERRREGRNDVALASARGVLYAFDVATGNALWFARIGPPNLLADLPVRTTLGEGGLEVAIVPGRIGDQATLTARNVLTGEPAWHQTLEAAAVGRPVPYRDRLFVALKDPLGTIAEFDLLTGNRVAQFALRQPVGPGMALDAIGGRLYVAAAARRVFVLDVGRRDENGRRLPPQCVQILATDHAPDGLLCEPIPVGVSNGQSEQRFLIVSQKVDPGTMKLRSFALPEVGATIDLSDMTLSPVAELTAAGWLNFPPVTDGERVSFVTDQGQLAMFGINQQGNLDKALFSLPMPEGSKKAKSTPGQVVVSDEDGSWVIADGQLNRYRASVTPVSGLTLQTVGVPFPAGDPLHRSQIARDGETAIVTVRNPATFGCRVIAYDLRNGEIRWQRQLGAVSPASVVKRTGNALVHIDDDGGVTVVPNTGFDGSSRVATESWNVALAPMRPTGRSHLVAAADGKACWALTPERRDQTAVLRVRLVSAAGTGKDWALATEHRIAGVPIAFDDGLLIPMSDGIVYRLDPAAGALVAGPNWRAPGQPAEATAFLLAGGKPGEFYSTDGGNGVQLWRWPEKADKSWSAVFPKGWEALGPIVACPMVVGESLLLADANGLSSFPATAPGEPKLRWKIPSIRSLVSSGGKAFAVAAGVTMVDPASEAAVWTWNPEAGRGEPVGITLDQKRLLLTDADGLVVAIEESTGRVLLQVQANRVGLLPTESQPAIAVGGGRIVLPLLDGTAIVILAAE